VAEGARGIARALEEMSAHRIEAVVARFNATIGLSAMPMSTS
jgi:hypothetical protein